VAERARGDAPEGEVVTNFLPISYATRPALADDEMLDQSEVDAIIEREQREADAWARAHDRPVYEKSDQPHVKDASSLIEWFNNGADGQIDWGSPGDWEQCVSVASDHMDEDQARGFCQLRHIDATGMTTSEHAHQEGKRKYSPDQPRDHGRFASGGGVQTADLADQARVLNYGESLDAESDLAQAIYARTGGTVYDQADHDLIVDAIQASEHDAPVLYRGFAMNEANGWSDAQREAFTSQLRPDAVIEMRLGSYTKDPAVVQLFAGVDAYLRPVDEHDDRALTPTGTFIQQEDERVIIAVQAGAQALNMEPNAAGEYADQHEWATTGSFLVESVEHADHVWKVQVSQMDSTEPTVGEGGDFNDRRPIL
jgi:hypothetical protein